MPIAYFLIGPPGAGKSTWRHAYLEQRPDTWVVSQDDLVDEWAAERGLSYSQAFKLAPLKQFARRNREDFEDLVERGHHIILDRTNMSQRSRAPYLGMCLPDYTRVAVVFETHPVVLADRLARRARATGKYIPEHVVVQMQRSYEAPTEEEFDEIITVPAPKPTAGEWVRFHARHAARWTRATIRKIVHKTSSKS